jgi:DNA-binding LytR/AlgR family response regulator
MHQFVYFKSNGIYFQVAIPDICYMEAVSKYVKIVTVKKVHLAATSMWCLEKKLPQNLFCRIHRSFMVSLQHISRFDNETVYIDEMTKELPIGKQYKGVLQQRLFIINGDEKEISPLTAVKPDNFSIIEFPRDI